MLRRQHGGIKSYDSDWDEIEQKILVTDNWDGIDRRTSVERRTIVQEEKGKKSPINNYLLSGAWISILISLGMGGYHYIDNLNNRAISLEYKLKENSNDIDTLKIGLSEIKNILKEQTKANTDLNDHLNSLENTISQMYRNIKK